MGEEARNGNSVSGTRYVLPVSVVGCQGQFPDGRMFTLRIVRRVNDGSCRSVSAPAVGTYPNYADGAVT